MLREGCIAHILRRFKDLRGRPELQRREKHVGGESGDAAAAAEEEGPPALRAALLDEVWARFRAAGQAHSFDAAAA